MSHQAAEDRSKMGASNKSEFVLGGCGSGYSTAKMHGNCGGNARDPRIRIRIGQKGDVTSHRETDTNLYPEEYQQSPAYDGDAPQHGANDGCDGPRLVVFS